MLFLHYADDVSLFVELVLFGHLIRYFPRLLQLVCDNRIKVFLTVWCLCLQVGLMVDGGIDEVSVFIQLD